MKNTLLLIIIFLSVACAYAQKSQTKKDTRSQPHVMKIPMEPAYWDFDSSRVEFVRRDNIQVVQGKKRGEGYSISLKDVDFSDGTIEYDIALGFGFPGIYFRTSEDQKNGENFYIRAFGPATPEKRTTLQYSAVIDGISIWDLSDEYQSGATLIENGWNHVKLVISGKQMKAYVNDMNAPALVVPELEGRRNSGKIYFSGGDVAYANFEIKPNATDGLSPEAGFMAISNDTRYLRSWMVSQPSDFPFGREVKMKLPSANGTIEESELPDSTAQWLPIRAEGRAIVNLTRKFGHVGDDGRRLAWLKTTIESDRVQERTLSLGFSDEVWVFINGQILLVDKNYFGTPSQKSPKARCTIENASIRLPLQEGKNEILIALANYFYGWGIVARLDDTEGIRLQQ